MYSVCIYVYIYIYVYMHTGGCVWIGDWQNGDAVAFQAYMYIYVYMCICIYTYIHIYIYTYIYKYILVCIYICTNITRAGGCVWIGDRQNADAFVLQEY